MLRLHERTRLVEKAEYELDAAVAKIVTEHDLTYGEILSILSVLLSRYARFLVRTERHPDDPDKKGDEA